jgi:hypothetical protein
VAIDPAAPRTRRAILGAALGGAGALFASALGRATPVAAATGDPVVLGEGAIVTENATDLPTVINSLAAPTFGTKGDSNIGILGQVTGNGIGVRGMSVGGWGLDGRSDTHVGVQGSSTGPGSAGRSTGVIGFTGGGADLNGNTNETGVYGFSDDSTAATGVWGDSIQGTGVVGTGDWGVYGFAGDESILPPLAQAGVLGTGGAGGGIGVRGHAAPGGSYGIIATASSTAQYALYVSGKLRLSRSGRVSVASTATTKVVTLAGVTTASYIIATLQTSISGCYVRAVVPKTGGFTIYLSKAPGRTAVVGYVVVN